MADKNDKGNNPSVPEITSIADEEALTEIDLGSFLADKDSEEVVFDGYHEDIKQTEKSLDDELQSLYDSIMNTGPATIVPKKLDDLAAEGSGEGGWMSPEEYIDIPETAAEPEAPAAGTAAEDKSRDDILKMIEELKTETQDEEGFNSILSEIESNESIAPVVGDIASTGELTKDAAAQAQSAPAEKPAKNADGIDTDSEEFESELAYLLGDAPAPQSEPVKESAPAEESAPKAESRPAGSDDFVINIPDESAAPAPVFDLLPNDGQRTVGVVPDEIVEDNGKISRKEKRQAKIDRKEAEGKKYRGDTIRKIVLAVSIIVIIVSSGILVNTYIIEPYKYKKNETTIVDQVAHEVTGTVDEVEKDDDDDTEYPTGMLAKYKKLYATNNDLSGWVSIPGLEINLPIAQAADNDYYLHRNIFKKWTNYGVPFFDYRIKDLKNLPKNTVVYGHNMHYDDLIFGMLENYREPDGFKKNPIIECNTIFGDHTWLVYAAFITNSRPSQDNGYLFPYNFIDLSEERFSEYIKELDKRKFYTTGVDIRPGDKILTLSTCCYDFEDGRLVIVARLKRDDESNTVDTSRVMVNSNPKYPQAWYDANKKTNPYVNDSRF